MKHKNFTLGGFFWGVFVLGGFCPRGFCPGGFCPRTGVDEATVNRKISSHIESRLSEYQQFGHHVLLTVTVSCCFRSLLSACEIHKTKYMYHSFDLRKE